MAAALRARRRRPDLDITVVESGPYLACANCSIPAYLDGRLESIESLQNLTPEQATQEHRLNVLIRHLALEIDPRRHALKVRNLDTDQEFSLPYHRLILATGARPIIPPIPNVRARGIFTLRHLQDAQALRHYLETRQPRHFVVVGTGTIAQVCAASLRSYGMEVMFIGQDQALMADLEKPINERIYETLLANRITVYFADNIISVKVSIENEVQGLELPGRQLICDGILFALGVQPNTSLAQTADLDLGISGAIRVDRHLVTSRQAIYACGDCAHTTLRINHKPFYWPLAATANRQGRQAGENASGGQGEDAGTLAARIWRCFDLQIGRIGLSPFQAIEAGFKPKMISIKAPSRAKFYGGEQLDLILIYDQQDGRILGAQMASLEGILARMNAVAAAIIGRLTLKDLEDLDFAYTPELSALRDPLQIAARQGRKH